MAMDAKKKPFIMIASILSLILVFFSFHLLAFGVILLAIAATKDSYFGIICNPDELYYVYLHLRSKTPQIPSDCTPNQAFCYEKLMQVSRSFAVVILGLNSELREPISLFYLVCRGLDTIEDDMKPSKDVKIVELRNFHKHLKEPGWNLKNFGDKKSEIELLEKFDKVVDCLSNIKPKYLKVIIDVAYEMGNGMADFLNKKVESMDDYNLYCWYVAGLVGEGLSRLFAESGLESTQFSEVKDLYKAMGLFLQKTNITRDYLEDISEVPPRIFYPKAIWGKYVDDVTALRLPQNINTKSVPCLNEMITDAMSHANSCLQYLEMIKDPSVFKFCAIPQVMAIATLYECYNNPNVFKTEVKIRKSLALKMVMTCGDFVSVLYHFLNYCNKWKHRIPPLDPNAKRLALILDGLEAMIVTRLSLNDKRI